MARLYHKSSVAALVSGGIESAYLLHRSVQAGQRIQPLYVRQGFRWEMTELTWLRKLLRSLRSRHVASLVVLQASAAMVVSATHWSRDNSRRAPGARSRADAMYLPGRNIQLLLAAAIWCSQHSTHRILHGALGTNPFHDATPAFFRAMSRALTQGLRHRISCEYPLRRMHKTSVVNKLPRSILQRTFSCASPIGLHHCGHCNKCAERLDVVPPRQVL